ncbi:MAG: phenylalanine--tRNA ligase subunit beta [Pirellulaceae bacterium]
MLVSWNWLKDYVPLEMSPEELAERLAMSGLNHEGSKTVGDDLCVDLEVTSNRTDCLGHIGVAREISVLWQSPLKIPAAEPNVAAAKVDDLVKVRIDCPELCYRYTARVIRGVKIGPSPDWLADRLRTIGLAVINNVVDATNYVLMECGQPLHAFDLAELGGPEIVVREAIPNEEFEAIDHKTYPLEAGMCVIADKLGAVALGGVMGGADTEVSEKTTDLLIESAEFAPTSIRATSRKLNLHSPSSFRFERGVDPAGVDWASRRCCQLILQIAGGELAEGVLDVGRAVPRREPVVLRFSQLQRVLGIDVPREEVRRILAALGTKAVRSDDKSLEVVPPSWRRDLTREIDLVEEAARIHGYDKIPEDVRVPMTASHRSDRDRVQDQVRRVLTGVGFDEAMTASMVPELWSDAFSPWSSGKAIVSSTPLLRGADVLRRSLVPSLLEVRRINESLSNPTIEQFETANVYLPRPGQLPDERSMLAITSGGGYFDLKGVVETIVSALNRHVRVDAVETSQPLLAPLRSAELRIGGQVLGYLGEVTPAGLKAFGLRSAATVAELSLAVLESCAELTPQYTPLSPFPPISQDLNFVVAESLPWAELADTVRTAAGELLEALDYRETYRDPKTDGPDAKRLLLTITLRSATGTLTGQQAEAVRESIIAACDKAHDAKLLV